MPAARAGRGGWNWNAAFRVTGRSGQSLTASQLPAACPAPGGDAAALGQALDCDLGGCPLTNTMPVLREGLLRGGSAEFTMAWVSVPALVVRPVRQRYAYLRSGADGSSVIRYHSGTFTAEVTFGPGGLVTDYPGLGRLA